MFFSMAGATFRDQQFPDHGFYAAWGDYSGYPNEVSPLTIADLFNLGREYGDVRLSEEEQESRICYSLTAMQFIVEASCDTNHGNVELWVHRIQPDGKHSDMSNTVKRSKLANGINFSWSGDMTSLEFEDLVDEIERTKAYHAPQQD